MNRDELKDILLRDPRSVLKLKEDVVKELWQLSSDADESKTVKKAAKKALYILRSGGIDVAQKRPSEKKPVLQAEMRIADDPLLSVPDSIGSSQLVIPVEDDRGVAFTLYRFIFNTQKGVLQFSSAAGSRSLLQKLSKSGKEGFFPVSPDYAFFRLAQALQKTDTGRVSGLDSLPDVFKKDHSKTVDHPVLSIVPTGLTRIYSPEEGKSVFSLEEVSRLSLPEEDIEAVRARIKQAQASKLILDNKNPEERAARIIDTFYETYFTKQKCLFYKTLFLDIALACYYRGLEGQARVLVNMAKDLTPGAVEHKEHPVLNYLMYQAFGESRSG